MFLLLRLHQFYIDINIQTSSEVVPDCVNFKQIKYGPFYLNNLLILILESSGMISRGICHLWLLCPSIPLFWHQKTVIYLSLRWELLHFVHLSQMCWQPSSRRNSSHWAPGILSVQVSLYQQKICKFWRFSYMKMYADIQTRKADLCKQPSHLTVLLITETTGTTEKLQIGNVNTVFTKKWVM